MTSTLTKARAELLARRIIHDAPQVEIVAVRELVEGSGVYVIDVRDGLSNLKMSINSARQWDMLGCAFTDDALGEDDEQEEDEQPVKRGRGRPPVPKHKRLGDHPISVYMTQEDAARLDQAAKIMNIERSVLCRKLIQPYVQAVVRAYEAGHSALEEA